MPNLDGLIKDVVLHHHEKTDGVCSPKQTIGSGGTGHVPMVAVATRAKVFPQRLKALIN